MTKEINKIVQLGKIVGHNDGFENINTGLGIQGIDKRTGGAYSYKRLNRVTLENAYDCNDVAERVVDLIPSEGTKKWIENKIPLENGGAETVKKITDYDETKDVKGKFKKAWQWARLYGKSAIFMVVDDGLDLSEPLNPLRVRSLSNMVVIGRHELYAGELTDDLRDPNFGEPEYYSIAPKNGGYIQEIHHSRFLIFDGATLSDQKYIENSYSHESVLSRMYQILMDYDAAYGSVAHTVQDFNVSILKLNDLAEILSKDDGKDVIDRLKLMNLGKSIIGSILLDAENETYENMTTPLTGLDGVLGKLDQRLVMATQMPHTIILGQRSTGSLGGEGKTEEKNFYALVSNEQDSKCKKNINRYYEITFSAKDGPTLGKIPKDHSWQFVPLWEPSEEEVATVRKTVAETDAIYIVNSVLSSSEVAESRFGGDEYSMETNIDVKNRKAQKEIDEIDPEKAKKIIEGKE